MLRKFGEESALLRGGEVDPHRPALLCVGCRSRVTEAVCAVEVQGAHRHTFTNPAALTFTIGCFSTAPGCSEAGPATLHHTWFSGHRWRVATCAVCARHLGWRFLGPLGSFFGLILDRLIED